MGSMKNYFLQVKWFNKIVVVVWAKMVHLSYHRNVTTYYSQYCSTFILYFWLPSQASANINTSIQDQVWEKQQNNYIYCLFTLTFPSVYFLSSKTVAYRELLKCQALLHYPHEHLYVLYSPWALSILLDAPFYGILDKWTAALLNQYPPLCSSEPLDTYSSVFYSLLYIAKGP